jgi:hypothetical protein
MNTADIDSRLIEGYTALLKNMSTANKLDLISKLTQSVKSEIDEGQNRTYGSFGQWEGDERADEMINVIRESRTFNREREEL